MLSKHAFRREPEIGRNDFTVGLSDAITGDVLTTVVFSYGLLFALLALLKKPDFIFN